MADPRQIKWHREKLEWIFSLPSDILEKEAWDIHTYWHEGKPNWFLRGGTFRTVFINTQFEELPTEIDGWQFVSKLGNSVAHSCPGQFIGNGLVQDSSSVELSNNVGGMYKAVSYTHLRAHET